MNGGPPPSGTLPSRIPVTILTGFLGAGKTTLLNALLRDPALSGTGVVVNEFGEIGIDGLLLDADASRSASGGVIELSGGCLCCAARGDLVDALLSLGEAMAAGRRAPLRRLIVEASGLADPGLVLAALLAEPRLAALYRFDACFCVLDARAGAGLLGTREEARRQVLAADAVLLSKTDLATPHERDGSLAALEALGVAVPVLDAAAGEAGARALFPAPSATPGAPAFVRLLAGALPQGHGHPHAAHSHGAGRGRVGSLSIHHVEPVDEAAMAAFAEALVALLGPRLLRLKGVVRGTAQPGRPLAIHAVAGRIEAPRRLEGWPPGVEAATRLAVIADDLPERAVRDLFAAFANQPAVDAPDRAAVESNPLAVPNFTF